MMETNEKPMTKKELEKERKLTEKAMAFVPVTRINPADLPPLLRIFFCQTDDPIFATANLLCAMAFLCVLCPRLVFDYVFDGRSAMHHLLLQLCVVAQSADGKSFSGRLRKLLLKPLLLKDKEAEAEELKYAEMKKTKGQNKDRPEEPVTVKLCLIKFTKNKIVKRAHMIARKYGGENLIFSIFTDELSTLIERRGSYGDLRDIAKLAYDWDSELAVDTNSDASYNATVSINWVSVYNTTPAILYKYIDKEACESGNVNRMIFLNLGDRLGVPAPKFRDLTEKDLALVEQWQEKLMAETYGPGNSLMPIHEVPMEWLHEDEEVWCKVQLLKIKKTCSDAHNSFYKRASNSAARLACLAYHLWGEDPSKRQKVRRLYYFLADFILQGQMQLFGRMYEKTIVRINDNTEEENNTPLYDLMPQRFTRDMLKAKINEMGFGTEARKFIYKWREAHLICDVEGEKDVYEKLY